MKNLWHTSSFDLPMSIQSTESNPIRLLSGESSWKPYKSSSPLLALFITLIGRAVYLEKNTSKHFIKFYRKMFSGSKKVWVELVYLNKFVSPI